MGKYIKCPRCELNWILEENEYCDVCKAELGMEGFSLLDDEEEELLCPVCGVNYIDHGEKMCADCKAKHKDDDIDFATETPSSSEDTGDIEVISFDELEQEESDDKFDIYEDTFDDPDGFAANDFDAADIDEEFAIDEEEEDEESVSNEDDEFEKDFDYNIDDVDTSDLDEEEIDDDDDDDDI